jgi:hypothetical protein
MNLSSGITPYSARVERRDRSEPPRNMLKYDMCAQSLPIDCDGTTAHRNHIEGVQSAFRCASPVRAANDGSHRLSSPSDELAHLEPMTLYADLELCRVFCLSEYERWYGSLGKRLMQLLFRDSPRPLEPRLFVAETQQ